MSDMSGERRVTSRPLRDLVQSRLGLRWPRFARDHPHLAEAIDRTRLIESGLQRLEEDAALRDAMRRADIDEAALAAALQVVERADSLLERLLP